MKLCAKHLELCQVCGIYYWILLSLSEGNGNDGCFGQFSMSTRSGVSSLSEMTDLMETVHGYSSCSGEPKCEVWLLILSRVELAELDSNPLAGTFI